MAKYTIKSEKCDYCHEVKQVKNINNMNSCSMCQNMLSMIRQRPQIVYEWLQQIAPQVIPGMQVNDEKIIDNYEEQIEALQEKIKGYETTIVTRELELEEAEHIISNGYIAGSEHTSAMTDLAVRLAVCMLKNQIDGITVDDIELLRCC